jgi:hypothetical protein
LDPITILTILGQFAPTLIKWATGSDKAATVAGMAVETAKSITGAKNMDDSVEILKADPEKALAFQTALLNQDSEFEKLYVQDKADARARDVALQATPKGNVRANWLVGIAVIVIFAIILIVVFKPQLDEYAKGVLTGILGMYIQQLANIYAFEFGTTRRSREKTDVIDNLKS